MSVAMKSLIIKIGFISVWTGILIFSGSCTKDLLDQEHTTEVNASNFWKTEADATYALMGAYSAVRPCFDRDYYFDGQGEYVRTRSISGGDAYQGASWNPTGYAGSFDNMYRYLYGGVNRANYVIENGQKALAVATPSSVEGLERVIGEARLLRGIVYFRLITMWGDVPYISKVVLDNSEVSTLARTPIAQVKDSIMADFTYAFEKLPVKASAIGRASKPSALAFRGKLQLYWASWNRFGWPELAGFVPDAAAATAAYTAAAADFKSVISDYGLALFRGGEPGNIDALGKADILPNYYYLFTSAANADSEILMGFTHGGTGTGQGEAMLLDFANRSHESSQLRVMPRYEIADRYQLITTGDFANKLIPLNPGTTPSARTTLNSAVNPASYANRDYRMKASIMWDFEVSIGFSGLKSTGWVPYVYQIWTQPIVINGVTYTTYGSDNTTNNSGYVFRKFVRNTPGLARNDGDYTYPIMRLADVYLMYAEATNATIGPQADAINLLNKIRRRGNLPALKADKYANSIVFFNAIEQERIIELVGEGQRSFDLRRWRAIERVWGAPGSAGVWRIDTYGVNKQRFFQNTIEREYQQDYIFRIPPGERDRNPNLTQNTPWL